jgi:hypothetical protein
MEVPTFGKSAMETKHSLSGSLKALLLGFILISGSLLNSTVLAGAKEENDTTRSSSYSRKAETYNHVELSFINFDAVNVRDASAQALGVNLKGGVRLTEIVSLEGGINWLPLIPELLIPLPLSWMPSENGIYLNLGAGLRFNLVRYHSHRTVPWVSVWRVGHAVLSDFSVAGVGTSYGLGVESKTDSGKSWQISMIFHEFTGDLEIYDGDYSREYKDADIRAVELNIAVSMK